MSWFVERRLDFIAWRLSARESVRRSDIVQVFGVSLAQASGDIAQFERAHPGAIVYDKSSKQYCPGSTKRLRKVLPGINWSLIEKD